MVCLGAALPLLPTSPPHRPRPPRRRPRRCQAPAYDEDLDTVPAEPDFHVITLPTNLRLPKHKLDFRLTHRFARGLRGGELRRPRVGLLRLRRGRAGRPRPPLRALPGQPARGVPDLRPHDPDLGPAGAAATRRKPGRPLGRGFRRGTEQLRPLLVAGGVDAARVLAVRGAGAVAPVRHQGRPLRGAVLGRSHAHHPVGFRHRGWDAGPWARGEAAGDEGHGARRRDPPPPHRVQGRPRLRRPGLAGVVRRRVARGRPCFPDQLLERPRHDPAQVARGQQGSDDWHLGFNLTRKFY